jgi:mannose-6-phosphate isomerase
VAIEHACTRVVSKPWGSTDLLPWSDIQPDGVAIGELWFQRRDVKGPGSGFAAQVAVYQRAVVDSGSSK